MVDSLAGFADAHTGAMAAPTDRTTAKPAGEAGAHCTPNPQHPAEPLSRTPGARPAGSAIGDAWRRYRIRVQAAYVMGAGLVVAILGCVVEGAAYNTAGGSPWGVVGRWIVIAGGAALIAGGIVREWFEEQE